MYVGEQGASKAVPPLVPHGKESLPGARLSRKGEPWLTFDPLFWQLIETESEVSLSTDGFAGSGVARLCPITPG